MTSKWTTIQAKILDSKYVKVSVDDVTAIQKHLTPNQQAKLHNVLHKHKVLFDSKLGRYPHKEFHLELIDSAQPIYSKPYSIPY